MPKQIYKKGLFIYVCVTNEEDELRNKMQMLQL